MIQYILDKIRRHRQKRTFHEYGYENISFQLAEEGEIQYARWLHPFYNTDPITQSRVDFYKKYVKPGQLIIDIGAHEGDTTVPMALVTGKQGAVIALEPNPHVFKVLAANAGLNKDRTNIIPLNFAATATDGEFTFGSGDAAYGNGGIVGFSTNTAANNRYTFKVQGKNLYEYLTKNHKDLLTKLALIKIDTEGYDKEILKNIKGLLAEYRPIVISECFKQLKVAERNELYDVLADQNYVIHHLPDFNGTAPIVISRDQMNDRKHFDIIAFPKETMNA